MNKKIIIPVIAFSLIFLVCLELISKNPSIETPEIDFIYSDVEKIQKILAMRNILMSPPSIITDHTVKQYCTFFDNDGVQQFVSYCITTAILDSDGNPLGNINMGGNPIEPNMALAIIQTGTSFDSKTDKIVFVFETMVETLVCDCWAKKQPGGFESVSSWIHAAEQQYRDSSQSTLISKIDGLAQKQLVLEITSSGNSYLWTLIVVKVV
ncbi:MAG: hypothetical protein OEY17_04465 [Nitrosopumilus sp.]|nr:hypothetical protein [Nitrosopumilus sp.]MDH5658575.1 hypothetical protein [Nitrosopumilus sp.]